jgi:FG-GAP repeat
MRKMRRLILVVLVLLLAAMTSPVLAQESRPGDVAADFNNDGFADLAIGVPGEGPVGGAVNVLYGTAAGLTGTGAQLFTQIGDAPEFAGGFGSVLAAADFDHDNFSDLAIGAPLEDLAAFTARLPEVEFVLVPASDGIHSAR